MSATEDARLCLDRASQAQRADAKGFYLDQGRTLAILAVAEAIQHVADELATMTADTHDKPPW